MNWVILLVLGIVIYFVFFRAKHLKEKISIGVIVMLLLFFYISYSKVTQDSNINYKSVAGIEKAAKLYFSWLGAAAGNLKGLTGNAVKMDWGSNATKVDKPTAVPEIPAPFP